MADHYTPNEITQIFNEYFAAIKQGKTINADLAKRYKDAQKGVKNYTDNLNASLKQLSRSGTGLLRSLKDGKKGLGAYNDVLGSAADVVANVASQLGPLGAVFGAVVQAGAKYVKEVTKQADTLHDAYNEMSRIGATGSKGMTGVFEKMQKMGYGINELGNMTDLLAEGTDALAGMGGTVGKGLDRFADLASDIQRSGVGYQLQTMGMDIDSINKASMGKMRQDVMLGGNKMMSQTQLKDATVEYLYQQDKWKKITGKSTEQIEEQLDRALQVEAYNQTMYELKEKADAGDEDAKNQMAKLKEIMTSNLPDDIKEELQRAVGGDFGAANKIAKIAPDALKLVMDNKATTAEAMDAFRDGFKKNIELRGSQAKLNTYKADYGSIAAQQKYIASLQGKSYADLQKSATEAQTVGDELTQTATSNVIAQKNVRDGLQSMLQEGMAPLAKSIAYLGKAVNVAVDVPADLTGVKGAPLAPAPKAPPPAKAPIVIEGPKISGMDSIKAMIAQHEGIRTKPYKDSKGLWTIGVGHLIGDGRNLPPEYNREFSMKEVMDLFEVDFAKHVKIAERTPGYDKANETGKGAMIDLAFNMGQWWTKFPNTSKALSAGDFKAAAAGLQDSAWYKQVGNRGPKIVGMIAAGGKEKGYAEGGIPTGPQSGYTTTLHGTEAVIPMKENKIPVQAKMIAEGLASRSALFEQNMTKISDLVRLMSKQVDVSQRIFQTAH